MSRRDASVEDWLVGGGEMGKLVRSMDWTETPLGPIESWPQNLRTTVNLALASNLPVCLVWGPKHTQIYNDGYRPICGGMHPRSMGQDFVECWASAWHAIGEAFDRALAGEASDLENRQILLDRNGYDEEAFFTFSFSPIRDETGGVGGLFHPVTETTSRMLGERRTRTLRDLAVRAGKAPNIEEALTLSAQTLADAERDLPFVLFYLTDSHGKAARLIASTGLLPGSVACPEIVSLQTVESSAWPLAEIAGAGSQQARQVDNLEARFGPFPSGPYPESPKVALMLPILPPGCDQPAAFLVAGVSSRLPFNEAYRSFYDLLAAGVTSVVADARAHEQERQRVEALAQLDRAKTAFFSNISHELRTPLTLLLGPTEEALASPGGLRGADLEMVHRNALRLLKLVNTLLDFSRIEAGSVKPSYEPTDLAALTTDLASAFRSAVERGGLSFDVDCPPLAAPVGVDRAMWEKIVLNLLSNAFKFTFTGSITVALRSAGDHVELSVRDTGVGIPEAELTRVFDRFHRIQGTRARTHEGAGIGLALVHDLVKLHGGDIRVESELGQGTTFLVSIPTGVHPLLGEPVGAAGPASSDASPGESFGTEALRWLADGSSAEPPGTETRRASPSTARILMVEDNADMRDYVARLLRKHWTVVTMPDGAQALEAARRELPDLIVTDAMMPVMDGFQLVRELRADPRTRAIPVIVLSARAGAEATAEGLLTGADDYLVKPFSARVLFSRVEAQLTSARLRAAANLLR